ncbi:hypothetical protein O9992_27560 [Vibrio lentus]|nr:hypothetical protein [Vibrio lentus]
MVPAPYFLEAVDGPVHNVDEMDFPVGTRYNYVAQSDDYINMFQAEQLPIELHQ